MEDPSSMSNAEVIAIPTGDGRRRRLEQATRARRRLEAARRGREPSRASDRGAGAGRAWLNGREVGGPARRYAHLGRVHD